MVTEMHLEKPDEPGKERFNYLGQHRYLITLPAAGGKAVFIERATVVSVLQHLRDACLRNGFDVYAYCFMPDRLVMLARGKSDVSDMKAFLQDFRAVIDTQFEEKTQHPLWSKKYLERVLRKDEVSKDIAREFFKLPVTAGMVRRPGDYGLLGSLAVPVQDLLDQEAPSPKVRPQVPPAPPGERGEKSEKGFVPPVPEPRREHGGGGYRERPAGDRGGQGKPSFGGHGRESGGRPGGFRPRRPDDSGRPPYKRPGGSREDRGGGGGYRGARPEGRSRPPFGSRPRTDRGGSGGYRGDRPEGRSRPPFGGSGGPRSDRGGSGGYRGPRPEGRSRPPSGDAGRPRSDRSGSGGFRGDRPEGKGRPPFGGRSDFRSRGPGSKGGPGGGGFSGGKKFGRKPFKRRPPGRGGPPAR